MARGRKPGCPKTGGRDFLPGNPGKPKGARPPLVPASVKAILVEVASEQRETIKDGLLALLHDKDRFLEVVQFITRYVDGRPPDEITAHEPQAIHVTIAQVVARTTDAGLTVTLPPAAAPAPTAPQVAGPPDAGEVAVTPPTRRPRRP